MDYGGKSRALSPQEQNYRSWNTRCVAVTVLEECVHCSVCVPIDGDGVGRDCVGGCVHCYVCVPIDGDGMTWFGLGWPGMACGWPLGWPVVAWVCAPHVCEWFSVP